MKILRSFLARKASRVNRFKLNTAIFRSVLRTGDGRTGAGPATGTVVALFNPRSEAWADHFVTQGGHIADVNTARRVELRGEWLAEGDSR